MMLAIVAFISVSGAKADVPPLALDDRVQILDDQQLWSELDTDVFPLSPLSLEQALSGRTPVAGSLTGRSGAYVARIPLTLADRHLWFVVPNANYVDTGLAYWQPDQGATELVAEFAQSYDGNTPQLMHSQAFPLLLGGAQSGTLWIVIKAKHFPAPVKVTFFPQGSFFEYQFLVNGGTLAAIVVMLVLGLLSLVMFVRTRQRLTLYCAGYVGLHGIGWAALAGALSRLLPMEGVNPVYAGMHLFPFAIACAALFTRELFNCAEMHPALARWLKRLTWAFACLGVVELALPFQATFYLAHVVAVIWVVLSVGIGVWMLSRSDFRARYFLAGNLAYSLSLIYFMLAHTDLVQGFDYRELVVVSALAFDCVCIMLSMTEWFRRKQKDFMRASYEARVDPLTQVGNRMLMNERLDQISGPCALVFIDFDGFKAINDRLGHDAGDRFLSEAAAMMRSRLGAAGEVFRTGGDEFIWLLESDTWEQLDGIRVKVLADVAAIEQALQVNWPDAGISFGLATSSDGGHVSACLAEADRKMYQHKASKKALGRHHQEPESVSG